MRTAGDAGLKWTEADFVAYVHDPTGFLRTHLDDLGARRKISFKLRSYEDAAEVQAYIASLGAGSNEDSGG